MSKDLDNFDDILDGVPEPDAPVSDTKASPKGESVPADTPTVEEEIIDEGNEAPKTEEPEKVPEGTGTEEKPEMSPYEKEFYELGLDKQFKGGLQEMLARVPDMNRYITQLEHERNALRQQTAPKPEPEMPINEDEWQVDPVKAIQKLVDSRIDNVKQTVDQRFAQSKYEQFVASKPDFSQMESLMSEQFYKHPYLEKLGLDAVPVLYQLAKTEQIARAKTPPYRQGPSAPKESATTSVGKKESTPSKDDPSYWVNKTQKEMEAELGFSGN